MSQKLVTILRYPAFLFPAALISSQRYNAILTGKIDAVNLLNYNVQITLCKAYLQDTARFLFLLQQHLEIQLKTVSHCAITYM